MPTLDQHLIEKLDALRLKNNVRKLTTKHTSSIDFTSNDYLGLARNEALAKAVEDKFSALAPRLLGSTGSRLLSGNTPATEELERKLAKIFKSESTLIFNSGYNANLSVLSSIPQKNDLILYDELVHASIKDGIRLSFAARFPFRHNDIEDLEAKLKRSNHERKYMVVESIYSMGGDACSLPDLVVLAQKYNATIILDEAHSTGVLGENGNGLSNSLNLHDKIGIRIYTFGKAMGTHGACVAGSRVLIDYLINTARPFIYTTSLPSHAIISIGCAFDFLKSNTILQDKLRDKVKFFLQRVLIPRYPDSSSAIQCIVIPGNEAVKSAADFLQKNNFDVRPILSPTVAKGSERLRICLHTFNSDDEIARLAELLNQLHRDSK